MDADAMLNPSRRWTEGGGVPERVKKGKRKESRSEWSDHRALALWRKGRV
jgi:hypothetical protein